MFIDKKEHVILYETAEIPYRVNELKRLYDCGVRTMLIWGYWKKIEPKRGKYDWSRIEDVIDRATKAKLKLIINAPADAPSVYPDSWYLKGQDGKVLKGIVHGGFSYWHKAALEYRDHFTKMFCKKFSSETVLCASSFYNEGEYMMSPDHQAFYDDAAIESFASYIEKQVIDARVQRINWLKESMIDFALRSQKIYAEHNVKKELWQQLHW
ncbi:hypothetical protein EBU71_15280, partial [bacterium]|nr:hypothetical protein [Candidatus Elulimicrobium humile]